MENRLACTVMTRVSAMGKAGAGRDYSQRAFCIFREVRKLGGAHRNNVSLNYYVLFRILLFVAFVNTF